jgi:hypothetical protein
MFDNLFTGLLCFAYGLALMSATGIIVVHKIFGPDLPPGIQMLADLFMAILNANAKIILGPFELLRRISVSVNSPTPHQPSLPNKEVQQITKQ